MSSEAETTVGRGLGGWLVSDRVVMGVILLNAVALLFHEAASGASLARRVWYWIDYACVVFFVLETVLKTRAGFGRYWKSGWNRFDFLIVLVSLPALLGPMIDLAEFAFVLVLRLGRLFRLFRMLRFIPNLDHLVLGIRRALHASIGVFLGLLLTNFILAMASTLLFREVDPERFGNPLRASYSIFQVFTLEGWNELPERLGMLAAASPHVSNPEAVALAARLFFVLAVVVGGLLGLSLANAVFVDQMMMDNTDPLERKVDALAAEIRELRSLLVAGSGGGSSDAPPGGAAPVTFDE
jgi:voltage-gated sodium channel